MAVQPAAASAAPPCPARPYLEVLVAFDASESAWVALHRAVEVAQGGHARLTLVAVAPEPSAFASSPGPWAVPITRGELVREIDGEVARNLAAARDEIPADIPVTTRMRHGKAIHEIAREIASGDYDLLVLGPRTRHGLWALLHHSVTRALLARAPISVLAAR